MESIPSKFDDRECRSLKTKIYDRDKFDDDRECRSLETKIYDRDFAGSFLTTAFLFVLQNSGRLRNFAKMSTDRNISCLLTSLVNMEATMGKSLKRNDVRSSRLQNAFVNRNDRIPLQ